MIAVASAIMSTTSPKPGASSPNYPWKLRLTRHLLQTVGRGYGVASRRWVSTGDGTIQSMAHCLDIGSTA